MSKPCQPWHMIQRRPQRWYHTCRNIFFGIIHSSHSNYSNYYLALVISIAPTCSKCHKNCHNNYVWQYKISFLWFKCFCCWKLCNFMWILSFRSTSVILSAYGTSRFDAFVNTYNCCSFVCKHGSLQSNELSCG